MVVCLDDGNNDDGDDENDNEGVDDGRDDGGDYDDDHYFYYYFGVDNDGDADTVANCIPKLFGPDHPVCKVW